MCLILATGTSRICGGDPGDTLERRVHREHRTLPLHVCMLCPGTHRMTELRQRVDPATNVTLTKTS